MATSRAWRWVLVAALLGCGEERSWPPGVGEADVGARAGDGGAAGAHDVSDGVPPSADGSMGAPGSDTAVRPPPPDDAQPPPTTLDAAPVGDVGGRSDTGAPGPDVEPPPVLGNCDPRLRAAACNPGQFCERVEGEPDYVGRCFAGGGCRPAITGDCPDPARPYCHVQGAATVCTSPGLLRAGEDCVDDSDSPIACAEGLVCNYSVCTAACAPAAAPAESCAAGWRCADVSEALGVEAGMCRPPACDFLVDEGCEVAEKCAYAIRADGQVVGSCRSLIGEVPTGERCTVQPEGGDDCAPRHVCIGAPGQATVCRLLCDTGAYRAPCPQGFVCREILQAASGRVRGIGLCVVNP